jgi:hypothetical protein
MCDVHLIETERRHLAHWQGLCSFCEDQINGPCDEVVGELDDGSPGSHHFHYHPDCLDGIEYDGVEENDGCFSYGRPTAAPAPSTA